MRKGFTLVELLAVIVVIGLLTVIVVPEVSKIIDASRTKVFEESERRIEKAAEVYKADTGLSFAGQSAGYTYEITYEALTTAGYLEPIYDPLSDAECSGGVVLTKLSDDTVTFSANIVCENYSSN